MTKRPMFPFPEALAGRGKGKPDAVVGCNGCTACCRDNLIALFPDDGDDLKLYGDAVEWAPNPLNRAVVPFIKHGADGACVFLGPGGCTIYDKRPLVCRKFDCREVYLAYKECCTPTQIKQAIRRRGISRDVFMAGKARQ